MSDEPVKREKPTHYKVICISIYTSDLDSIDRMVDALKARGWTNMTRSKLFRLAASKLDLDLVEVPRSIM